MTKNGRVAFKEKIGELIKTIKNSKNEIPKEKLKDLRILMQETKEKINTIERKELKDKIEIIFLVLGSIKSKSENLTEARNIAFKLLKKFKK
jgi:hypothetical protein